MSEQQGSIAGRFSREAPAVDFWTLRLVEAHTERLSVRQDVLRPPVLSRSRGALVSVVEGEGAGYAATGDLSPGGLAEALRRARDWAEASANRALVRASLLPRPDAVGDYASPVGIAWEASSLASKIELLQGASRALKIHGHIVDWEAWLGHSRVDSLLTSAAGARISQRVSLIDPGLRVVANRGSEIQIRTGGGARGARQGGLEQLSPQGFPDEATRVAEEALALLDAPECPSGTLDLLLMPSQMALQIHESIGHPLELDRILGDERNYAGTSFVRPEMFGRYRYGSELLNVTFDPCVLGETASYGYDDEGMPARRVFLIRNGILERPLGGVGSQVRAGLVGTANARACDWDRLPIDRMANLNLEPGSSPLAELVGRVERGVLMDTNSSWSIDDSRNKFQFGCELGRLIRDGELRGLVRNPNYRGVSEGFWRSLVGVGNADSFELHGVNSCGKGEPNQMIAVGHASPPCLFRDVAVFGGGD